MRSREHPTGQEYGVGQHSLPSAERKRFQVVVGQMAVVAAMLVVGIVGAISCTPSDVETNEQSLTDSTLEPTRPRDLVVVRPTPAVTRTRPIILPRPTPTVGRLDETERAAVELFSRELRDLEPIREAITAEFQVVWTEIDAREFDVTATALESFASTLESVIRQQEELVQELESLDLSDRVTEKAQMLLEFVYTEELRAYRELLYAAGQPQMSNVIADIPRRNLRNAESYSARVDEELYKLLDRLRLTRRAEQLAD